jgi:hypothetical protein
MITSHKLTRADNAKLFGLIVLLLLALVGAGTICNWLTDNCVYNYEQMVNGKLVDAVDFHKADLVEIHCPIIRR